MSEVKWTFPGGKPKQEVTSVTLVNNTAKTVDMTVPSGKQWILLGVRIANMDDVDRACTIRKYVTAGKTSLIAQLFSATLTATGGRGHFPGTSTSVSTRHVASNPSEFMVDGNTLSIVWAAGGASAGVVDVDGLVVEYLEVDAP